MYKSLCLLLRHLSFKLLNKADCTSCVLPVIPACSTGLAGVFVKRLLIRTAFSPLKPKFLLIFVIHSQAYILHNFNGVHKDETFFLYLHHA